MSKFTDIECKKIQKLSLNFEQEHSYATLEIKGKFIKNVHLTDDISMCIIRKNN